jgi:ABC-type bacteriocin/lantibiotic exporter with double-glycine peptidase domain
MLKIIQVLEQKEKKNYIYIVLLIILLSFCEALTFFFLQPILSYFSNAKSLINLPFLPDYLSKISENINYSFLIFFFFFILRFILSIIVSYKKSYLVKSVNNNLSNKLYEYYLRQEYQFYIDNQSSNFIANISLEVEKFSYKVLGCIIGLITEIFLVIAILIFLFTVYFYATLLFFVVASFLFFFIYNFFKLKFNVMGKIKVQSDSDKIDIIQESFYIIQNIKLDNLENFFIEKFKKKNNNASHSQFLLDFLSELPKPIIELFILILIASVVAFFYYYLSFSKQDIIIMLSIYAIAMFRILPSFNRILGLVNQIRFHSFTTDIIYNIIQNNKISNNKLNTEIPQKEYAGFKESIKIENLCFKYSSSQNDILSDINIKILKNEIIGISGDSGSGKSTLLNLICFLLKPTKGRILIDNLPLENIYKSFQPKIGYVPQKIYLTNDSIIDNVIFGQEKKEKHDLELFNRILDMCNLRELIDSKYNKEHFLIGERGAKLSGGQQQRIGIARALYKQPDILILDEATNALEIETEKQIIETILNLKEKLTIILVTHNKSILNLASKIYEISNGKITQVK